MITVSLLAGVSTGIGALPIYFKREFSKSAINLGMAFSAGIMLVASFVSLLIPSLDSAREIYTSWYGLVPCILGLIIGYKIIIYMHAKLPHEHLLHLAPDISSNKINRVYLIVLAICLHNVPEGLSVGVGFGGELEKGISLGIAIAIQNLPEGLVVALGLLSIGMSKHRSFFLSFLSGMVEPVAALFGFYTTTISQFILPFSFAFAGGAMLFVVCQEMFPEMFEDKIENSTINGLLLGVTCMLALEYFIVYL